MDETQAGLDDERVARLEREAQSLKRVGEDIFRLQEKLDLERVTREQTLGMVQVRRRLSPTRLVCPALRAELSGRDEPLASLGAAGVGLGVGPGASG